VLFGKKTQPQAELLSPGGAAQFFFFWPAAQGKVTSSTTTFSPKDAKKQVFLNFREKREGEVFCFQRLAKAFIGADSETLKMRRLPPTAFLPRLIGYMVASG
jgi:hypothetical protein